jgi:hypothetical protein
VVAGRCEEAFVTGLTDTQAAILAAGHVAAFNAAVHSNDFSLFLDRLADDAVLKFENVPGAGNLEFAGREAYTKAYAEQPPDDKIDIAGPVRGDGLTVVVPFTWKRDGSPGTMRLTYTDGPADELDERCVTAMTVRFG